MSSRLQLREKQKKRSKQTTRARLCTKQTNTKLYTRVIATQSQANFSKSNFERTKVWLKRIREKWRRRRIDLVCLFGLGEKLQQSKRVNASAKPKGIEVNWEWKEMKEQTRNVKSNSKCLFMLESWITPFHTPQLSLLFVPNNCFHCIMSCV